MAFHRIAAHRRTPHERPVGQYLIGWNHCPDFLLEATWLVERLVPDRALLGATSPWKAPGCPVDIPFRAGAAGAPVAWTLSICE